MTDKLVLVSHQLCPYVQRAAIALAEKGVAYERVYVDLAAKPEVRPDERLVIVADLDEDHRLAGK